jgi:hypothetical protein
VAWGPGPKPPKNRVTNPNPSKQQTPAHFKPKMASNDQKNQQVDHKQEAEDFALEDVEEVEFVLEDWMDPQFVDDCQLCRNFFYNKDFEAVNCDTCVNGMAAYMEFVRSQIK